MEPNQRYPPVIHLGISDPYGAQTPSGKPLQDTSTKKPDAFLDVNANSKRFSKPHTKVALQPPNTSFEVTPVASDQQHMKFVHQAHPPLIPPGPNPAPFYPYPVRNASLDGSSFPTSSYTPYPAGSYPPPQDHQPVNHGSSVHYYHPYSQQQASQADPISRVGFPPQQIGSGVQPLPTINQKYPGAHFSSSSSLNEIPKLVNNIHNSPHNALAPLANNPNATHPTTVNVKEKKKVPKPSSMSTRKRALTACDTCRFKKIRCDNNRPKCGSCLKSGNDNCHYRIDDIRDFLSTEVAEAILGKLDFVLKEIKDIKTPQLPTYKFDNCIWDMGPESVLKWRYLRQNLQIDAIPVKELLQSYEKSNLEGPQNSFTMAKKLQLFALIDKFLVKNCISLLNSFFILIKFPVFDMIAMYQCVEFCRVVFKALPDVSFVELLETRKAGFPLDDCAPDSFKESLNRLELKGSERFLQFYGKFCTRIPILIVACSIAVVTSPVQLDNIAKYNNSMEERSSDIKNGSLIGGEFELPDGLPSEKITILKLLVDYALFLNTQFTKETTKLDSCIFNILMNQYHLSTMNIMTAYNHIVNAGQDIMYHLEMIRADRNNLDPQSEDSEFDLTESVDNGIADRLYWICYKLESEMRVELSPHVPLSGITTFPPPRTFPKLPSLLYSDLPEIEVWFDESGQTSLKELTKLEEQNVWYYFLTEAAVRKVDNKMFDELYSHDDVNNNKWDSREFVETGVWTSFIKFQNRYNGIINSMSPNIRNFVLYETDAQKVYKAMKGMKLKNKKQLLDTDSTDSEGLLENLFREIGENPFNDDSLTYCQSESIMFIKTRILTSKLLLFRPIVYLFLHDLLPLNELILAALEVMEQQYSQQKPVAMGMSPDSLGSLGGSSDGNSASAAHVYQKLHPDEDFTDLILEINDDNTSDTVPEIVVNDVARARFRVLKVFLQLMLTLPNLNIARLGAHRHAGLWYFVRNVFLGHLIEFLLYKKLSDLAIALAEGEIEALENIIVNSEKNLSMESVQHLLKSLLPKERIKGNLEFCQLILEYWSDESPDCVEFRGFVQSCLDNL